MGRLMSASINDGWDWPILPALLVALALVALIGLVNGLITTYTGVPSFIVTLGMLFFVTTLNRIVLDGLPVDLVRETGTLKKILGADLPGTTLAAPFVWMVGVGGGWA